MKFLKVLKLYDNFEFNKKKKWNFWNFEILNFKFFAFIISNFLKKQKFRNFMKFSNILISKQQFMCNKKPYYILEPRNSFIDFARECNMIFYCTEIAFC